MILYFTLIFYEKVSLSFTIVYLCFTFTFKPPVVNIHFAFCGQALPTLSTAGFGAELLAVFGNGMVQSFINARTLSPKGRWS